MNDQEVYETMGAECGTPAKLGPSGTVADGKCGVVAVTEEFCDIVDDLPGVIGYYDDDDVDEEGEMRAIVYFGIPFASRYHLLEYEWIRPATTQECLSYLQTLSGRKEAWKPDREMPMLDAILAGEKLWNSGAPALVQKNEMKKVAARIREEHDYMLEHEPQDQFHACVLLGALNVIEAAISRKKPKKYDG